MEITRGKIVKAVKVCIYGPEGIGKSTLASRFPDPVFIDTEGSTNHMDVARFDAPSSWPMLIQEVEYVRDHPDCCRTLVIDTADWAEKLCTESVLAERKMKSIEDAGYGKGYTYLREAFGKLLNVLTDVVEKGINVVITAHAQMRKFEQPDELGAYDRWELKLSKQCSPLVKEWADMILFCNYKTMVVNVDNQGAVKGKNKAQGGRRVMYTSHHPCWDAKNRFGLPEEIDMDYSQIAHIFDSVPKPQAAATVSEYTQPAGPVYAENEQLNLMDKETRDSISKPESVPETPKEPEPAPPEKKDKPLLSMYLSDPEKIPKNLRDLMEENNITEWNIQDAAFAKGYYPENTLIQNMDPEFVQGWIVAFWPQVCQLIEQIRNEKDIPF